VTDLKENELSVDANLVTSSSSSLTQEEFFANDKTNDVTSTDKMMFNSNHRLLRR
jgi:hypothetical protein